jgi:hypothetical protein
LGESTNRTAFACLIAKRWNARCGRKERHRWREWCAEFFDERIGHAQRFKRAEQYEATGGKGEEARASAERLFDRCTAEEIGEDDAGECWRQCQGESQGGKHLHTRNPRHDEHWEGDRRLRNRRRWTCD